MNCHLLNWPKIFSIDLAHNEFDSIPPVLLKMESLRYLDLSNNHISHLPKKLFDVNTFTQINLSGNPIPQAEIDRLKLALSHTKIIF
jgi:Leucine-rich repeat (LRR) protein